MKKKSAGEAVEVVAADATGHTGPGTSHSANTVSVTNGDTIICFASLETGSADVPAGDADTTNGNWSAVVNRGSGGGAGGSQTSFFFSSRRRHTRWNCDWSSDVCSSD